MQKPPDALFTFRVSLLQMPKKCIHCQYARLVSKTKPCLRRSECDTNKKLRAHNQRKKSQQRKKCTGIYISLKNFNLI